MPHVHEVVLSDGQVVMTGPDVEPTEEPEDEGLPTGELRAPVSKAKVLKATEVADVELEEAELAQKALEAGDPETPAPITGKRSSDACSIARCAGSADERKALAGRLAGHTPEVRTHPASSPRQKQEARPGAPQGLLGRNHERPGARWRLASGHRQQEPRPSITATKTSQVPRSVGRRGRGRDRLQEPAATSLNVFVPNRLVADEPGSAGHFKFYYVHRDRIWSAAKGRFGSTAVSQKRARAASAPAPKLRTLHFKRFAAGPAGSGKFVARSQSGNPPDCLCRELRALGGRPPGRVTRPEAKIERMAHDFLKKGGRIHNMHQAWTALGRGAGGRRRRELHRTAR